MRGLATSAALVGAIALLAACAPQPGSSAGSFSAGVAGRALNGTPLESCVVSGEVPVKAAVPGLCGTLVVAEDRANPVGRQIGLRVAVVPALAATPAPDPLFAIAGGPGDPSTQFFAWLPGLYADVHARHDIVLVDQRGTGANAMMLPATPDVSALSTADADAAMAAWARDGLAALDGDPRFYTSTVAAEDLDAVRLALGYDRINLYGTSYGGTLAQYYMRQHPDRVQSAILDGATPVALPVLERMAASSQHALDLLLARCARDTACHAAFPDLAREWATVRAGLEGGIETNVVDPDTGQPVVADLLAVAPSLHDALRTSDAAGKLPLAIHLAAASQWERTNDLVPPASSGGDTLAMTDEIFCSEAWARFDPAQVERTGAGSYAASWQVANANARAAMCRALPRGVVPPDDDAPAPASIPVLWLVADGDPQDPPANLSATTLGPDSRIVVVPAQEHVVGHLGCGPTVISDFLEAGTARGVDATCLEAEIMPNWTLELP